MSWSCLNSILGFLQVQVHVIFILDCYEVLSIPQGNVIPIFSHGYTIWNLSACFDLDICILQITQWEFRGDFCSISDWVIFPFHQFINFTRNSNLVMLSPFTHLGYVAEIFKPLDVSLGASLESRLSPCSWLLRLGSTPNEAKGVDPIKLLRKNDLVWWC